MANEFTEPDTVAFALQVKWAQHLLGLRIDEQLRPIGLNLGLWGVMHEVGRTPGASASELARAAFHTPQTVGGLLQRLEERGLVERTTGRGRIVENRLTGPGQEALDAATAVVDRVVTVLLKEVGPEERGVFQRLVGDFVTGLHEMRPPAAAAG